MDVGLAYVVVEDLLVDFEFVVVLVVLLGVILGKRLLGRVLEGSGVWVK